MSYWTSKQKILFVDINLHLIISLTTSWKWYIKQNKNFVVYIIFVNKYLKVSSLMSYRTSKQKILFVDINLHLIKIVYHFMEAGDNNT